MTTTAAAAARATARRRASAGRMLETLERRQMLAAGPFNIGRASPVLPTTNLIKDIKNGPLAKGGAALVNIFQEFNKFVKGGGNRYQFKSAYSNLYNVSGQNIFVTLRTTGNVNKLVASVKEMGGRTVYKSKDRGIVEAFVPINRVDDLSARRDILHVRPMMRPILDSVGFVGNDAERSQKTEYVLPSFGVDGTGQKVGVLSDSFDWRAFRYTDPLFEGSYFGTSAAQTSFLTGDLPTDVDVVQEYLPTGPYDTTGSDEGRAMLELIHDLAPGADLAFHSVGTSPNTFAAGIRALREAGSTVIVDDVRMAEEPFFGEGVIDRAINDVNDDGAVYLSSQGNYGFAGYSGQTNWVADPDSDSGLTVNFDPTGKQVDTKLDVHFDRAGTLAFQWDDVYDGSVANVTADVDFYLYRKGALISSSIDDNFATGVPAETVIIPDEGDYEVVIRLNSLAKGASAPQMYKFVAVNRDSELFDSRSDVEYPGYNSSTWGHSAAEGNIPIGAVDNASSNAFGTARDISSQDFSSGGPSVRLFDANGNRLEEPQVILTPLVSGIQGTNTSVFGFQPFFGTSASAPNVAALVALLRQIKPSAAPEEIKDALVESAKTQPLNGTKPGEWDPQAGYGLVDGLVAASILNPDIPVATIDVAPINTGAGVGSITVRFSEPVTGVDMSDFILTRDGSSKNRFSGGEDVETTDGGRTWVITNTTSATQTLGTYTLFLRNAPRTEIEDADGNAAGGNVFSFDVTLRKVRDVKVDQLSDGRVRLRWTDTNNGEDGFRIQRSTDANFGSNVKTIDVGAGATSYVDNEVSAGEVYYYRIRPEKGGRLGDVFSTRIINGSRGEIFIDQEDADLEGGWATAQDGDSWFQSHAFARRTSRKLENVTPSVATFTSPDLANGEYFVYIRYEANRANATNATVEILKGDEIDDRIILDQTKRGGGWVLLGKMENDTGEPLSVRLTSLGANGNVVADAVRFLPANEATIASFDAIQAAKKKKKVSTNVVT